MVRIEPAGEWLLAQLSAARQDALGGAAPADTYDHAEDEDDALQDEEDAAPAEAGVEAITAEDAAPAGTLTGATAGRAAASARPAAGPAGAGLPDDRGVAETTLVAAPQRARRTGPETGRPTRPERPAGNGHVVGRTIQCGWPSSRRVARPWNSRVPRCCNCWAAYAG